VSPVLRPYQVAAVNLIRDTFRGGHRRALLASPTGSGKTIMFAWLAAEAARRGKRVLVLGHRQEIVDQISAALAAMGVAHGLIAAGRPTSPAPVQVAGVMTLVRRLHVWGDDAVDLVVIDEAHHAVAGTWRTILDRFARAYHLVVTATPERLDGRGLGDMFNELIIGPSVKELVDLGFLAPAVTYAPSRAPDLSAIRTRAGDYALEDLGREMSNGVLVGNAVEHYARLCPGAPALAYCVNIAHSELVAQRFRAAGFRARHVDGETPRDERRAAVAALAAGELDIITNCGLFSEGVDVPALGAVILLRPTKSLALYLQMVGRALRPAFGKERALILDHAGNTLRHGLYDFPHTWSLEGKPRRGTGEAPVRQCPECGALVPLGCRECPECGALFERAATPEESPGELEEVTGISRELQAMPYRKLLKWADGNPDRLRLAALARGYRPGWVWHVWRTTPREGVS
jgi:superfamily II DNA or RNA helicase